MASTDEPKDERELLAVIGIPADLRDPSGFDLLCVPEDCEGDEFINKRGREQVKGLKKWEQYRANPQVQKMAMALMARISDAQRKLRTADGRAQYRKELQRQRVDRFRERIRPVVVPGESLPEDRIRQLLQLACQFRVLEPAARRVIAELTQFDNPFAVLGLVPVPADETWPTAFDILQLEESDTPPPNLDQQVALQLHKLETAARAGKVTAEQGNKLRLYVEEARRTLGSEDLTKAYGQNINDQRANRFAETVSLAKSHNQLGDTTTLIQLVHQGRQMRLCQFHVEFVIERIANVKVGDLIKKVPVLLVSRKTIEAFVRGNGENCSHVFSVRNDSTGVLDVSLEPSAVWIELSEAAFQTETRKDVTLTVLPRYLAPGEPAEAVITVRSNGGEAQIEVKVMLGQPGSEPHAEDFDTVGGYYLWAILGGIGSLGFIPLSWLLMMNRKESAFRAFHALQAMAVGLIGILFLLTMVLLTPSSAKASAPSFGSVVAPCAMFLVFFGVFGYGPHALREFVRQGHNLQIPVLAPLLKRFL